MGGCETNTSLKKGFETDKAGRGQKDLMSCVDFNSLKRFDSVKFIHQLFMKIDRRFEEALGVGPRFISKGVYAHFWI